MRQPWYRILYVQVLIAVFIGILIGHFFPEFGKSLEPLGVGFVRLVKMIIAPIIFCTVVHGIASMSDLKKLGRIGGKALLYFEVVSTFALIIGLLVVNILKPGAGFNIDPAMLDPSIGKSYAQAAHGQSLTEFLLNIIPKSFFDAFATGDLLQILLVSVLTAFAISMMRERGEPILRVVDTGAQIFFGIMRIIVKVAPLAALGAMGFTVGSYGLGALNRLLELMLGFYLCAGIRNRVGCCEGIRTACQIFSREESELPAMDNRGAGARSGGDTLRAQAEPRDPVDRVAHRSGITRGRLQTLLIYRAMPLNATGGFVFL
jgi:aerobic C4-dicarboxylate transport protein